MLARVRKLLGFYDATLTDSQEIGDAQERTRSIVDHVIDGIITIDTAGTIRTFNPAAERIFGYRRAEVIGHNVKMLMPEPDRSRHDSYIASYVRTGEAKIIGIGREVVGQRKDGSTFPMELAISEFRIGRDRLFTGIVRDITERKQLEHELHQRLKQLAEADQRKDQFISMLGHELRNPLAPVSNGLQLLKHSSIASDARVTRTISMMERQVNHMVRLIDDLLDVSRITTGKIELRLETVDLVLAVEHALDGVRAEIEGGKGQRIDTECGQEHIYIHADAARIAQIVTNLVTNASKYSDSHSTIGVKVEQVGETARLVVSDTGIGIPPDRIQEIFEVFVQIDPSIERRQGGLGIGLALVKSLVELHGGTVYARSEGIGTGSEFVVELPVLAERRGVPRSDSHRPANTHKRRVLVIDDNEDAADSLAALLAGMGHEVTTLYTGDAAVEEVARQSPEVVLCDIGMPGVSGLDVARQLRTVFKERRLTLIAATGYGRPEDAAIAKAAGFDAHLVKPIDLERLQAAIAGR